jgi:hypothetical protein
VVEDVQSLKTSREISRTRVRAAISSSPRNHDALRFRPSIVVYYPFQTFFHSHLFLHWYFTGAFNATALYMWRSNVLSLRQCSSAGRLRHGVKSRWYSSTSSLPITEKEFEDALEAVLPRRWAMRRGDSQKASSLGTRNHTYIRIGTDCHV